jgi:MoCo/4Fe-4S cofactor protein with predicted Tat translocation signal
MSDSDRHINFKLMRDHILALQDGKLRAVAKNTGAVLKNWLTRPAFREFVAREFPQQAEEWHDPIERRTFIKLMGASLALAGLSGCVFNHRKRLFLTSNNRKKKFPAKHFSLRLPRHCLAPQHPCWCAATKADQQRSKAIRIIQTIGPLTFRQKIRSRSARLECDRHLYASIDSRSLRSRSFRNAYYREDIRTWTRLSAKCVDARRATSQSRAGIRFLTESDYFANVWRADEGVADALPQAKWHQYEPANRDNARAGA